MKKNRKNISKHALHRMIERGVLCQNKKLNKKQVKRNSKRAYKKFDKGLNNVFATSMTKRVLYKYSNLSDKGTCMKYVVDPRTNFIITVINVDIDEEIKNYNLRLAIKGDKEVHSNLSDYIFKIFDETKYLFVVDSKNKSINAIRSLNTKIGG
jgi:hypothetical protein